ncbi:MAG: single-stranded-DNA-specific exonuclease RecJ, partial [Planctomycetales bacterium]|nr:single-stranded-DNA-specific exonuclease RecJ [Planctomycetales bacterium]
VVPLLDENRLLVRHGLSSVQQRPYPGLDALLTAANLKQRPTLSSEDIAFMVAPRLNAAGRLGKAELGVELLTTDNPERAGQLAEHICELNVERDSLERNIYLAAQQQIQQEFDADEDSALVLAGRGWHAGVIGIVAGRLADRYCRPVVVISLDEQGTPVGTGSARSACGLNLYDAFQECAEHLIRFGGHAAAAGLRIDEQHIDNFRKHFRDHVATCIPREDRVAEIRIDAETTLAQLTMRTVKQIEQLAPFGQANPRPILCTSGIRLEGEPRTMGAGDRHLSVRISQGPVTLRAVAFGKGEWAAELARNSGDIEIAFRPVINEFGGRRSVELQLVDWRPQHASLHAPSSAR